MMKKESRLVYSSDPVQNQRCPVCKELKAECSCPVQDPVPKKFTPVILRVEKQGRNGKVVTVIDRLPKNEKFLQDLTTKLKKKCGAGGTFTLQGQIEIQGDKKELIKAFLEKEGIPSKG